MTNKIKQYINLMSDPARLPDAYNARGVMSGRKYLKFYNILTNGQHSAFQFIDKANGMIYRANSWKQKGRCIGHVDKFISLLETA